jgi:hypothetical protein
MLHSIEFAGGSPRSGDTRLSNDFHEKLDDPEAPVAASLSDTGAPLLVAFGGIAGKVGILPFEFFNLTKDIRANKIFIRDLQQVWYQQGLPGVAKDIEGIAGFLAERMEEVTPSRTVLVGNSMGGFAAIVIGILLNVDRVLAFAPQTFADRMHRLMYHDRRWPEQMREVHRTRGTRYLDAKPLLRRFRPSCEVDIFYSRYDRLDRVHAERLSFAWNVRTHALGEGGHSVIKHMRSSGDLTRVVSDALGSGQTPGGRP